MASRKARIALAIAACAAGLAAITILSAPFLAAPIVYIATGGERRIPFAALDIAKADNVPAFFVDYAGGLAAGEYWYTLPIAAICLVFAGALIALCEHSKHTGRDVRQGILGSQESVTSKTKIMRELVAWDGRESVASDGVAVGYIRGKSIIIPCIHAAVCAPSGARKTRGSVYPTIDALSFSARNNLIVTDPSMEIYITAAPALRERGYSVSLLDFEKPAQGCRYNPLKLITDLFREGDVPEAEARAREVGAVLFPSMGNENDIFVRGAGGVFSAVAYIVSTSDNVPDERRHIWSVVCSILEGTFNGAGIFKDWLRSFGADSPVATMAATFLASEDKLESSILSSLHDGLQPYTSLNMRWLTSSSDIDMEGIINATSSVFIHTLGPASPTNRVAALFFAQHWAETLRLGKRRGIRPCWVIGDEWHSVPRFDLVHAIENARKYGLHYVMYTQSFSGYDQYKTSKEDGKDAILSNCDVKALYMAGSSQDAEYFEKLSGFKTVRTESIGQSWHERNSGSSTTYSEQKVPVWPAGRTLERDPMTDGVLVIRSSSAGRRGGKYEIPMTDASTTFTAAHLGTLGSPDFEEEVMCRTLDALEKEARDVDMNVRAWIPNFEAMKGDETVQAEIAADEFGAWDQKG